jgi:hypothetical protein
MLLDMQCNILFGGLRLWIISHFESCLVNMQTHCFVFQVLLMFQTYVFMLLQVFMCGFATSILWELPEIVENFEMRIQEIRGLCCHIVVAWQASCSNGPR